MTAADVARSLGISRATVGFVFNDTPGQTISEPTRQRVLAEAERLGYRPHSAARALASGRSHIVLLLLPDWPMDHSIRTNIDEASLVLDRAGYSLVTTAPHPGGQAVPLWESLRPDVVLSLAPIPPDQAAAVQATGTIALFPGSDDRGLRQGLGFADGPRLQVEHLVAGGRRRLAYAATPDPRLEGLDRERADLAAATSASLDVELVGTAPIDSANAPDAVARWIADGVDGVVAYNDDIAALVLGAALRLDVEVPDQLAIVGHDDTPLASLLVPALSTVRIDTEGLGRFLAELALAEARGGAMPVPPPATAAVVRRETT